MTIGKLSSNGVGESGPDDIVITGMSGTFPGALNIEEFEYKLYNKIDMVSKETRYDFIYLDQPERAGIVPVNSKFDCGFFGIHERQAEYMDAASRICLEKCIEAILDAGLHPSDIENTKTGVFVGACVSESEIFLSRRPKPEKSFFWTGNARCMIANRISYFFKLKGPSFTTDTACSSSLYALEHAYQAIRKGEIDMAIVGGANLCAFAGTTIQFARLGVLSPDGTCKVFDEKANGYVRAEGICILLLQKKKEALRVYGKIIHAKTNCDGYKEEGITYPSGEAQYELLKEFYQECGVPPHTLSYLEAHGTGTKVGDPEECESIDQIFTKNRDKPLLIGSVKSCVGHSEPVSGCISMIKSILALEKGEIAPNLHFNVPKSDIKGIIEGRMKVVTDVTKFQDDRGLVGMNSFGFGGGNAHVLVEGNKKEKINKGFPVDNLPRLVFVSGRNEEAVHFLSDYIEKVGLDAEFVGLLHNAFRKDIQTHLYRGYVILSKDGVLEQSVNDGNFASWNIPPINIIFGDLDNWYSLLKNFIEVSVFSSSLKKIAKILDSLNLDGTVLSGKIENERSNDILGSIIVQICLVDLLKALKLTPKSTHGFSIGELACAYFDGVLRVEEVLQCANIFNVELNKRITTSSSNKNPQLRNDLINKLLMVLNKPKIWNGKKTVSAEYFADAVLSYKSDKPQNFVQSNSIVLEIGKNNIDVNEHDYENVHWMEISEKFEVFLRTLGSLYVLGYNTGIHQLYPAIKFPVSRGTPMLSSKILWNHERTYITQQPPRQHVHGKSFTIDLRKQDWMYISGHMIDGRILFPAAGYLFLAWEVLAEDYKVQDALPVVFENVRFVRATSILPSDPVQLNVKIGDSGYFEITERDNIVVTGYIREVSDESEAYNRLSDPVGSNHMMTAKDIYQELRLRGYNYQGQFQAMESCDITGCVAKIQWIENYVTFIDNLFQLNVLSHDTRLLYVPTNLYKVTILPTLHRKFIKRYENKESTMTLPAFYYPRSNIIKSGGIEVQLMMASPISRRKNLATPVLETHVFVPYEANLPADLSIRVNAQIIGENALTIKSLPTLEIYDSNAQTDPEIPLLTPALIEAIGDLPLVQSEAKVFSITPLDVKDIVIVNNANLRAEPKTYLLIIGTKLLKNKQTLEDALFAIWDNGFIISRESNTFTKEDLNDPNLVLVSVHRTGKETIVMLAKKSRKRNPAFVKLTDDPNFSWVPKLQSTLEAHDDLVVYSEHDNTSGILGFVNCLRKEPVLKNIQAVFIMDEGISFNASEPIFNEQLSKNLGMNVYKNCQWGTYRHLPIPAVQEIKSQHVFLGQLTTGDLSSLRWMEGPLNGAENREIPPDCKLVQNCYSSLNFKDIMIASGKISADAVSGYNRAQLSPIGMEYAGIDQEGNRIMGMSDVGALSTRILAKTSLSWKVPDQWSLEEAVTIPVIYATMLYGLVMRGKMKRGDSVLIHSGLGGVGQASIRYCLFHGVTVFTTVGSDQRKEVLRKLFPELPESHIGNSHDTSFEQMIMKETRGRGVDLVLNSLAEEKLLASVRCLAQRGRMIEIGKYDIKANNMLSLLLLKKEASFHGVMLDMFLILTPPEMFTLNKLVGDGIQEGSIKPLDRHVFRFDEAEQAFRFMAGGKHLGKVVIQIRQEQKNVDPWSLCSERFPALPRFTCDPKKSYVVIGGLGGFGLELTDWLILREARKVVLSSSRGFTTGYQRQRVNLWKSYGVEVRVVTIDLSTKSGCHQLIKEAQELGPVDAIFNLAVCLKDALFENQTQEKFKLSFTPKACVTKYLDELTRKMCPNLRNFVVFSSISCGMGNAGQTNYGMANSVMERICEARQRDGYPGQAIQWGAIGEVGILGEMMVNNAAEINVGGTLLQKISSCLQVLDTLLQQSSPIVSSIVVAEKTRGSYSTENAIEAVASILGVSDLKSVSHHATLAEIGMDSMTSVEIKQMLEREFDIFLSPKEIRNLTLARLQEIQNSKENGQTSADESTLEPKNSQASKTVFFSTIIGEKESQILDPRMHSKVNESEKAPTILVVPGIEGFVKNLEPLCEKLEAHIYGLQYSYAELPDTILDMARRKFSLAQKYLSKDIPFRVLAYSYGVTEALEMVSLLENEGYTGTVYCIDGAPSVMNSFVENALGTPDEIEANALLRILMVYNISVTELQKLAFEYKKCKNINEKVDKTLEAYGNLVPLSSEYLRRLIQGSVRRILAIGTYKPSYSALKSKVILFKPTETTFSHISEDFGISDICQRPVPVYQIEGNHNTILLNEEVSNFINSDF